jgi:LEA14-like dessication related protein
MMKQSNLASVWLVLCAASLLASCATQGPAIQPPEVTLTGVQLDKIDIGGQRFLLGFAVTNPNPFPLPVRSIRYDLRVDDRTFAGGETQSNFVVSARGDGKFVIGVELDLLQSVSQLATLFKGGTPRAVPYELQGTLAVDIPFARPIPFSSSGIVRLRSSG